MNRKNKAIKAFILIFFLFGTFAAAFRLWGGGLFISEEVLDEYEIRFSVKDISSNSVQYFCEGDTVTADGGVVLGKLEKIKQVEPTQVYVTDLDGTVKLVSYPNDTRVDVYGDILAYGKNAGGFYLNGVKHIASGDRFTVSTEHLDVTIMVTEIVKK